MVLIEKIAQGMKGVLTKNFLNKENGQKSARVETGVAADQGGLSNQHGVACSRTALYDGGVLLGINPGCGPEHN